MFIQTVTAAAIEGNTCKTALHNLLYAACVLNVPSLATLIRSALLVAPDKEMFVEQPGVGMLSNLGLGIYFMCSLPQIVLNS